jgi:molecular chaperone DnaK
MSASQDETFLPPRRQARNSASLDGDTVLPASEPSVVHASGHVIDNRYEVIREIGRGGMGIVYEVEDTLVGGSVAIKRLLPELATRKELVEVFKREGANAMRFTSESPRFVTMRHVGTDPGGLYLVMDYISDPTLRIILSSKSKSRLSLHDAVVIMNELASAVADLHRFGYIHRDLKPENIFVYTDGRETRVRLVDFGLTKVDAQSTLSSMRGAGTSGYASPEQRKGLITGVTADLYSFGVIAFEMLTGELPELGDSIDDYVDSVPKPLVELITSCLSARIERRPKDAQELSKQLAKIFGDRVSQNEPRGKSDAAKQEAVVVNKPNGTATLTLTGIPKLAFVTVDGTPLSGNSREFRFSGQGHRCNLHVKCQGHRDYVDQIELLSGVHRTVDLSDRFRAATKPVVHSRESAQQDSQSEKRQSSAVRKPKYKYQHKVVLGIGLENDKWYMSTLVDGAPLRVPNVEGEYGTPTVIHFVQDGSPLVGVSASKHHILKPDQTVNIGLHLIGTDFTKVIYGKKYSVEDFLGFLIRKLKADAEAYLEAEVTSVVLAIPTRFGIIERRSLKSVFGNSTLGILRMVSRPTALALAEKYEVRTNQTVMMICFDGGCLDVSILETGDGCFEVKSVAGDCSLGGCSFIGKVTDYFADSLRADTGVDITQSNVSWARLRAATEQALLDLTTSHTAHVSVPYMFYDGNDAIHFDVNLTRNKFNELTTDLVDRFVAQLQRSLMDAKLAPEDVDEVVFTGATCRIPSIREAIERTMRGCKLIRSPIKRDISDGLAIQAGILTGDIKDTVLLNVQPISLGIQLANGQFCKCIDRNTTIPTRTEEVFTAKYPEKKVIKIPILEGEVDKAVENRLIACMSLDDSALSGPSDRIKVTFAIDSLGLLSCSARHMSTGNETRIIVDGSFSVNRTEQSAILREACSTGLELISGIDIQAGIARIKDSPHEHLRNYLRNACHIPEQEFKMGGGRSADEQPVHTVKLDEFALGTTPVTMAMWREYAKEKQMPVAVNTVAEHHPMTNVSWNDCCDYCKWASELTGLNINLPTEAQWEYAARGGVKESDYPWGDMYNPKYVWASVDGAAKTTTGDTRRTNNIWRSHPFGLLDIAGNVWEWCLDWYDPNWYKNPESGRPNAVNNDSKPIQLMKYRNGLEKRAAARCIRGGSWSDTNTTFFRCAQRNRHIPDGISNSIGFRLCIS